MKYWIISFFAIIVMALSFDACEHHSDYKVAAKDLTILGGNLLGDVKAVTSSGDTVFVYGEYSSILYRADVTRQTKYHYVTPVGFTMDSVIVKPFK